MIALVDCSLEVSFLDISDCAVTSTVIVSAIVSPPAGVFCLFPGGYWHVTDLAEHRLQGRSPLHLTLAAAHLRQARKFPAVASSAFSIPSG